MFIVAVCLWLLCVCVASATRAVGLCPGLWCDDDAFVLQMWKGYRSAESLKAERGSSSKAPKRRPASRGVAPLFCEAVGVSAAARRHAREDGRGRHGNPDRCGRCPPVPHALPLFASKLPLNQSPQSPQSPHPSH